MSRGVRFMYSRYSSPNLSINMTSSSSIQVYRTMSNVIVGRSTSKLATIRAKADSEMNIPK